MTLKVAQARDELSRLWHDRMAMWTDAAFHTFATWDDYYGFCAAKDWLQDSAEVLIKHRNQDFSSDPLTAYLEFWGILQSVVVQQDAIRELSRVIRRADLAKRDADSAWAELRELRDLAVGHPTRRDRGATLARSVTGRTSKSYDRIELVVYGQGSHKTEAIGLGGLLDRYDGEAATVLQSLRKDLEVRLS